MSKEKYPEFSLDLIRVTEAAAMMSSLYTGFGDKEAVDKPQSTLWWDATISTSAAPL